MHTPHALMRLRHPWWLLAHLLAGHAWAQQVTVYSSGNVTVGSSRQLTAYVPISPNSVVWSVNGVPGGNAALGTVSTNGLYLAPSVIPNPNTVTVAATSTAIPSAVGSVQLAVTQVQPRLWNISPASAPPGAFTITLNGANFGTNVEVRMNGMPLSTTRASTTKLLASGTLTAAQVGSRLPVQVYATGLGGIGSDVVQLSVVAPSPAPSPSPTPPPAPAPNPGPGQGTANLAAGRFLEQAAFGGTPAEIARLRSLGTEAWLNEQWLMPETAITNPGGQAAGVVQAQHLSRLTTAPDQLRQRMAYALAQVLVISMNKNIYPDEIVPWLQLLSRHAFGNYRALLGDLVVSEQMGKFLDLANSNKPGGMSAANENLARELLQLFSIGLVQLNPDGSPRLDTNGRPLPSYDQATVQQVALALTGWTYAGAGNNNWENFSGPLVPRDVNHDLREKRFLGCTLLAGQTTVLDMSQTLDCVFKHPNVGPFVALRLIRQLVKSNPSGAYVQRVAAVFDNNGSGLRGDLRAVLRAVLLDAEARNDAATPDAGRLKDPTQQVATFLRAFGGRINPGNQLAWEFSRMAQRPLTPPSVFGFYSPLFRLPQSMFGTVVVAPEFQIYTPTEAVLRGNFLWRLMSSPGADVVLDWSPLVALAANASDPTALIDRVDQTLLYGRMSAAMRQSLATAIAAQPDAASRAATALYLTLLSGQHAVQH